MDELEEFVERKSLHLQDKLLFSFLMCVNLERSEGSLDNQEWLFLLTGGVALAGSGQPNPAPDWLPDNSWQQIQMMKSIPGLKVRMCGRHCSSEPTEGTLSGLLR